MRVRLFAAEGMVFVLLVEGDADCSSISNEVLSSGSMIVFSALILLFPRLDLLFDVVFADNAH